MNKMHFWQGPVVAISGKQFAGKDLLADLLVCEFPLLEKRPIALAIKQEYANQMGLTLEAIELDKPTHRPALIELGQSRRAQMPDYWLTQTLAEPPSQGKQGLIISDLRLIHEWQVLDQLGVLKIRVEAPATVRAQRGRLIMEADATECELDDRLDWDLVIENQSNREEYEDTIETLVFPAVELYLEQFASIQPA